jgi:hypothetical protein
MCFGVKKTDNSVCLGHIIHTRLETFVLSFAILRIQTSPIPIYTKLSIFSSTRKIFVKYVGTSQVLAMVADDGTRLNTHSPQKAIPSARPIWRRRISRTASISRLGTVFLLELRVQRVMMWFQVRNWVLGAGCDIELTG